MDYAGMKLNKGYKAYNRNAAPYRAIPRTTNWRLRKNVEDIHGTRPEDDSAPGPLELVPRQVTDVSDDGSDMDSSLSLSSSQSSSEFSISSTSECDWEATIEEDSSDEEDEAFDGWNSKLHDFTDTTVGEALYEILDLYVKHKLTKTALNDWLQLITRILPTPHNFPSSKFRFFQSLTNCSGDFNAEGHRYCCDCFSYLGPYESNSVKQCDVCGSREVFGRFINIPVSDTIKYLLEREKLYKHLIQGGQFDGCVCDIVDGAMFPSPLSPYDVHLMWNTDGIPVFKSSNFQIWPILFTISNVPPGMRKETLSLAGLWCGPTKPSMNTFLQPFSKAMHSVHVDGLSWFHPELHSSVNSKVNANLVVVDAKARNEMQNLVACNGYYGCSFCEHPGEIVDTQKGHVIVYNYLEGSAPLRDGGKMLEQAKAAADKESSVKGVLGPSCLSFIPGLNLSTSFIPDYMHAVAEGVVRQFACLWFDSKHCKQPYYIGLKSDEVNKRLLSIKPTNDVLRVPRSLSLLKYWKGSELRNWLLFYSPFCLANVLPVAFYEHWLLLVGAIYLLLQEKIPQEEIIAADILLNSFCAEAEELYGKRHMSYNVHQLPHLGDAVRNWGPLWASSCFMFEDKNGQLLSLIKGTQRVSEQLVSATKLIRSYHMLKHFISRERKGSYKMKAPVVCLGAPFVGILPPRVKKVLRDALGGVEGVKIHCRVKVDSMGVFTSRIYSRERVRQSNMVRFMGDNLAVKYGCIECFVLTNDSTFAVIHDFKVKKTQCFVNRSHKFRLPHIKKLDSTNVYELVNCNCLLSKILYFDDLAVELPNAFEINL